MIEVLGRVSLRPSEPQPAALAARESPYLDVRWSSEDRRRNRRARAPLGVDALVAWLKREWEFEMPDELHGQGIWTDRVTNDERAKGTPPVGSSELGAPAYDGTFRRRLENGPHQKIDGDLEFPLLSALAALRRTRRYGHDTIVALIYMAHFDWRSMAGQPFYRVNRDQSRTLVRVMDLDVLELVLDKSLEALWHLFTERESVALGPP